MSEIKKWTPGPADEAWKVIICARDAARASDLLDSLIYIVTDAGGNTEHGLSVLRNLTGRAIVDAVVAYQKSAHDSVRLGMKVKP